VSRDNITNFFLFFYGKIMGELSWGGLKPRTFMNKKVSLKRKPYKKPQ
jgi:hypothetical protein